MHDGTALTERPWGAVGTMGGMNDKTRQGLLDYCPELKMMFPALHSSACFGADPNVIECMKYLCVDGGLKCWKKNATVAWVDAYGRSVVVNVNSINP